MLRGGFLLLIRSNLLVKFDQLGEVLIAGCVVANFISLASPQAEKLAHFVAPPFPTKPALRVPRGPLLWIEIEESAKVRIKRPPKLCFGGLDTYCNLTYLYSSTSLVKCS